MQKHRKGSVSWSTTLILAWLLFLGFLPTANLLWPFLFIITLFLPFSWRFLLLIVPAKLLLPLLDPLLEPLGFWWLNLELLRPLFTTFANLPLLALSGYNSSLVAASFLLFPFLFGCSWLLCSFFAEPLRNFYEKLANHFIFSRVQNAKNLPRALRRPISEKKMQRWSQELAANRKSENLVFFSRQEGFYKLKDGLEKPQLRQLNRLYKTFQLKCLRRYSTLALLLLLFVTGVWVNWKKDDFLSNLLERSLGRLNGAQVDLKGLKLSLLQARLSFDELAFSNARQPEENSFQIGSTIIDVNNKELWLGRLNISEISSQSLLFNQARSTAGTVYQKPPEPTEKEQRNFSWNSPFQIEDVSKLIEEEWENLESQKLLDELVEEYQARVDVWEKKKNDYQRQTTSLIDKVEQQLQNTPSLTDFRNLNSQIEQGKALWQETQSLIQQGGNDLSTLAAEKEASERSWTLLQEQISSDVSTLSEKLAEFGDLEHLFSFLNSFLEEELKTRIANPYILKAYDFIQKQKRNSHETVPKKKRFNRKVDFLSDKKPFLYIDKISLDGGEQQPFYLEARHLSNQPQLLSKAMQFSWGQELGNYTHYQAESEIDLRTDTTKASLNADFLNFPLSLKSEFPPLNYQGLQNSSLTLNLAPDGWVALKYDGQLEPFNTQNQTKNINDILTTILDSDTLKIQVQLRTNFQQFEFMSFKSNAEQLATTVLEDSAGQFLKGLESEIFAELEQRLQQQWSKELLQPFQESLGQLGGNFTDITNTLNSQVGLLNENNSTMEKTTADLKNVYEEIIKSPEKPVIEAKNEIEKSGEDLSQQLQKNNPLKKLF